MISFVEVEVNRYDAIMWQMWAQAEQARRACGTQASQVWLIRHLELDAFGRWLELGHLFQSVASPANEDAQMTGR